ncbi:hypothetical protein GPECTOR_34g756 [Gonium pectorale]|uniref:Uncharacterized protein n=1 Tax=Gonium pectorale TaxID=33097 RepID=A0A150GCM5_GONPE|nr:hypothetical protein GPECTOR_34g756 [Gonium pectorale]|eukprot:KXZ47597.1 hypothetical protein GPECTOR_34g756 [Gonium pectorale]
MLSTDTPPSQAAADLNSQAQQMAGNTINPLTGSAPATASGPDSRTTGGASLMSGADAPPQSAGPSQQEGPDRRRMERDTDDRELTSLSEVPAGDFGVAGAPAVHSVGEAAAEGRRQRIEQEFADLGPKMQGTTH